MKNTNKDNNNKITDSKKVNYIKSKIRTIPNFPKEGIMFRDITTAIKDAKAFEYSIDLFYDRYKDECIDYIVGIESRGFIYGAALALKLRCGFVPIRKKGKLPGEVISEEYKLEYGKDKIEIHKDVIEEGSNVIIIDDLIATGGTCIAACKLVDKLSANILECAFVIDLPIVGGSKKLENEGYNVFSILGFEGE